MNGGMSEGMNGGMNFQDHFRDRDLVQNMARNIRRMAERLTAPVNFMEVCGTHTMSIYQYGIRTLLPENVRLVSGPGCPVCVTPIGYVDKALACAADPRTIVATFGDMLRVPGSHSSLMEQRAGGAVCLIGETVRRQIFDGAPGQKGLGDLAQWSTPPARSRRRFTPSPRRRRSARC